jgi:regulator of sirC expression with transglutaminase-like and TPR domain
VLVDELKYKERPLEWAYEGLAPLLLKDVLRSKRGISFSLAVLFSCVSRRLGLCLTPVPISRTGAPGCNRLGSDC